MTEKKIQRAITTGLILATVLRGIRKKQGQNQSQIAKKLGLRQSGWSRIERGGSAPTVLQLGAIAHALNADVSEILDKVSQIKASAENQGILVLDDSASIPPEMRIISDPVTLEEFLLIDQPIAGEPALLPHQVDELEKQGWLHVEKVGTRLLKIILKGLGEVIYVMDVKMKADSKALVTSSKALDFHTDHHRADYIVWHCIESAQSGGESILVDADAIFSLLEQEDQEQLKTINHYEHKVFAGDQQSWPLLSMENGKRKFYYTPWLPDKDNKPQGQQNAIRKMPEHQRQAYEAFQNAIKKTRPVEIKLQPDDVLIVDNGRMLHGRRAFKGGQRHLKRYWIQSSQHKNAR